jgi:hypothetical protein
MGVLFLLSIVKVNSLVSSSSRTPMRLERLFSSPSTPEIPSVATLRGLELMNANGKKVRLDGLMGSGDSVVVFLRHLG